MRNLPTEIPLPFNAESSIISMSCFETRHSSQESGPATTSASKMPVTAFRFHSRRYPSRSKELQKSAIKDSTTALRASAPADIDALPLQSICYESKRSPAYLSFVRKGTRQEEPNYFFYKLCTQFHQLYFRQRFHGVWHSDVPVPRDSLKLRHRFGGTSKGIRAYNYCRNSSSLQNYTVSQTGCAAGPSVSHASYNDVTELPYPKHHSVID